MLRGATDLDLAMDDDTCGTLARYPRFATNLRAGKRAKTAEAALKQKMTGVELKDWQEAIVTAVDEYDSFPDTVLEWLPSSVGSSFREFGMFNLHSWP